MPGRNHGNKVVKRPTTDFSQKVVGNNEHTYKLLEEVGHGGFGTVWRACNLSENKDYAVKVLKKAKPGTHHHTFHYRELMNHKAVSAHPNIVNSHGYVQDKENLYYVMDFLPGGNLLDLITKERAFARNDAFVKGIFLQLIDAVYYCHEQGIYHRDLKPANILLNRERSKAFITDFGLSTMTPVSTSFGTGSKNYMSPECIDRRAGYYQSARNDIWALGVILANMVTGRSPWSSAALDDDCFMYYLRNRNFLRTNLPISRATEIILRRIFTVDADLTIGLVELRHLVKHVDTFFMSDAEIAQSSERLRSAARYLRPRPPAAPVREVSTNEAPSGGRPSFLVATTTSDDLSDSSLSDNFGQGPPPPREDIPRALRAGVPPEGLDNIKAAGIRNQARTSDNQITPTTTSPTGSTVTSTQQDTPATMSDEIRSSLRLERQVVAPIREKRTKEKSGKLMRLFGQFRRMVGRV
ncbi:kinase-like domain-containing protein [Cristinia sonorae]|uniref:non-specific serine/threonine protein kinase n=1 Tax=Cristinia sonorae TaxID=1940300 RepID=A0A8K0XKN8_9AGAR|nr:kinase-like domain-containing protein [Cristinia sonorae]